MPQTNRSSVLWNRRRFVIVAGEAASLSLFAPPASGETEDVDAAIRELFGDRKVQEGRVSLKLPPIAENGNSVQLSVSVDSPMTAKDHVRQIAIFSPRNPIPLIGYEKNRRSKFDRWLIYLHLFGLMWNLVFSPEEKSRFPGRREALSSPADPGEVCREEVDTVDQKPELIYGCGISVSSLLPIRIAA